MGRCGFAIVLTKLSRTSPFDYPRLHEARVAAQLAVNMGGPYEQWPVTA